MMLALYYVVAGSSADASPTWPVGPTASMGVLCYKASNVDGCFL
jgi:hypothetical protein